ncbi:MAG: hypothetical protein ACO1SX_14280 [Actinomycetota bacterium]
MTPRNADFPVGAEVAERKLGATLEFAELPLGVAGTARELMETSR